MYGENYNGIILWLTRKEIFEGDHGYETGRYEDGNDGVTKDTNQERIGNSESSLPRRMSFGIKRGPVYITEVSCGSVRDMNMDKT